MQPFGGTGYTAAQQTNRLHAILAQSLSADCDPKILHSMGAPRILKVVAIHLELARQTAPEEAIDSPRSARVLKHLSLAIVENRDTKPRSYNLSPGVSLAKRTRIYSLPRVIKIRDQAVQPAQALGAEVDGEMLKYYYAAVIRHSLQRADGYARAQWRLENHDLLEIFHVWVRRIGLG